VKPIRLDDVLDLTAYELQRDAYRARLIALKRPRRVAVGDRLTFLFENRDTVLFQVQEMARAERMVKPEAIQHEIDVYSELLPPAHGLSATLMVEIDDRSRIRPELDRLIGIDEHVFLEIGGDRVQAEFDPKQFEQDRISAVQYVRFRLGPDLARRFAEGREPVALCVEHPNYRASAPIQGETRDSLARDLA
jgi:hypothetical protein